MKLSPVRFAFSALASLAMMATSADAATIFIFGQQNANDVVMSTSTGPNSTTFSSGPGTPAVPIPVVVTNLGGNTPPAPGLVVPETFSFTSNQPITVSPAGVTQTGFSGTFSFGGQVVGSLTNGVLTASGSGANTSGSFRSDNVVFTTLGPAILAQLGLPAVNPNLGLVTGSISISLVNLVGNLSALNFTAQNSGTISANVIPEPASVVMTSMALVAGLGGLGLRRAKASRA